jgi:Protein of unknown function (DUF2612)
MSVNTTQTYLDLITSEYVDQPNFTAVVSLDVSPMVQVQKLLTSMIPIFDLDTPPVGNQLDIIGQWVGAKRTVNVPITGVFFTWDSTPNVGWDFGIWASGNQTSITELPDDVYLTLIRATIAANNWDGTTNGAYAIWATVFPESRILIQDHEDMSYDLIFTGATLDSLTQALITSGYINLRPEGVEVSNYFQGYLDFPIFAWDSDTATLQGWDNGAWVAPL